MRHLKTKKNMLDGEVGDGRGWRRVGGGLGVDNNNLMDWGTTGLNFSTLDSPLQGNQ